jgi:nucleoside 2-deoxyribosyltransferase
MIVYLAGGINGLSDADAKDWREHVKKYATFDTLDPMDRDYRGVEHEPGTPARIVSEDLADIDKSDILLVNAPRPSWGTAMEIHYASTMGKTVITVVPVGPISPWLSHFSTLVFVDLHKAIAALNAWAQKERASDG